MVNERREEYYQEIDERKAQILRAMILQQLLEKMGRDRVSPEDFRDDYDMDNLAEPVQVAGSTRENQS